MGAAMKIEYLKTMHDANVGDVKDVEDFAAKPLKMALVRKNCSKFLYFGQFGSFFV